METAIPIKPSRKWKVVEIPLADKKPIKAIETPTGVTIVALSDMKKMGLYSVVDNLLKRGKLKRYNANGTLKLSDKKTKVYIDLNEFEELQEF